MARISYEHIQFYEEFTEIVWDVDKAGPPDKANQLTSIWTTLQ